jgi:signal transduction histidine kinase
MLRWLASAVALAVVVALAFGLALFALGHPPNGDEWELLAACACASAVAAVAFGPVRDRTERLVSGLGDHRRPADVLDGFVNRLSRAIPFEESLLQLAESLREELELTVAAIWTGGPDSLDCVVADPPRVPIRVKLGPLAATALIRAGVSGRAWVTTWLPELLPPGDDDRLRIAPIAYNGRLLGLVQVIREGEPFAEGEVALLANLSRQLALLLHNLQLDTELQASLSEIRRQADELRESRARLLVVADAERRRIERDLHDGAQQRLLALAMQVQVARRSLGGEPDELAAQLDRLAAGVTEATRELRTLSQGIYPPLLAESGLREALADVARRAPVRTSAELGDLGRYPAEIEASVYFCCLEALQNAAKHAGPTASVLVRVWEDEAGLGFAISDDGPGFTAAGARSGVGLVNMRDRISAAGGELQIESAPGAGTRIAGRIPVRTGRFKRPERSAQL